MRPAPRKDANAVTKGSSKEKQESFLDADTGTSPRRQLGRWSSDEKVERAMKKHMMHVSHAARETTLRNGITM